MDVFFILGFLIQFLVLVGTANEDDTQGFKAVEDLEFWITVGAIPIIILLILLAAYSTRRESIAGMLVTLVCEAKSYFVVVVMLNCCLSTGLLLCSSRLLHIRTSSNARFSL